MRTYLYHAEHPAGRVFDGAAVADALAAGWVDSPAKIAEPEPPVPESTPEPAPIVDASTPPKRRGRPPKNPIVESTPE